MILSIGCSHSCGPYDENDLGPRDSGGIYYTEGEEWPSIVSTMHNQKHRHIALPGMGMLQYYEVLRYLDENKLLRDVNNLIIQWTHEPRHILPSHNHTLKGALEKDITKMIRDDKDFALYSLLYEPCMNIYSTSILSHIFNGKLTSKKPNTEIKLFVTELMSNMNEQFKNSVDNKNIQYLVKNEINRICKKNCIQLFQINWIEDVVNILDIYNNTQYTNSIGHLNSLGNRKAINRIIRVLKQQGLFNV
jgi:hypothetical protein